MCSKSDERSCSSTVLVCATLQATRGRWLPLACLLNSRQELEWTNSRAGAACAATYCSSSSLWKHLPSPLGFELQRTQWEMPQRRKIQRAIRSWVELTCRRRWNSALALNSDPLFSSRHFWKLATEMQNWKKEGSEIQCVACSFRAAGRRGTWRKSSLLMCPSGLAQAAWTLPHWRCK